MKRIRHIAVICNYSLNPNRIGGMDRFYKKFNEQLLQKGNKISWFFSGSRTSNFYSDFDVNLANQETVENFFITKGISLNNFDVVVTHFLAVCSPFYKQVKKVTHAYVIAVDHNPRPLNGFPFKKRIKNKVYGLLYSKYINKFISVSQYSKKALQDDFGLHLKDKIDVIYNGIDADLYHLKKNYSKRAKNFLVTSHLRREKGVQDLILAVNEIKELSKLDFRIDLYGEGPYQEELKNLVYKNNLEDYFYFLGSSSILHEIYHNYDYLIQPSHGETFCYSIVESLLSGLPVITTRNYGNVLGLVKNDENGYLFEVKNIDELKLILKKLISGDLSIDKPFNTNRIRDSFSLDKMVTEHINLLPCISDS